MVSRMKPLPLSKVYQLIEPGPEVFLTTEHRGRRNVMTMSCHRTVEFEPPLIACIVSEANHSFAGLRKTGRCVIGIPTAEPARKVGSTSGRTIDKFQAFGLTPKASAH